MTDHSSKTPQGLASAPGWDKPLRQPTDFRPDFAGSLWAWISVGQTGIFRDNQCSAASDSTVGIYTYGRPME